MSYENQNAESTASGAAGAFAPHPMGGEPREIVGGDLSAGYSGHASGAPARGPFSPVVNGLLQACYGHLLDGITVAKGEGAKNRGMGAEAHTIGRHISLGDRVKEDPKDAQSMEIIGHEVAHALARGGSGQHVLDRKGDPVSTSPTMRGGSSGRSWKRADEVPLPCSSRRWAAWLRCIGSRAASTRTRWTTRPKS